MIPVAIVDDQHLFRQSLAALIKSDGRFSLVAEAANGAALLEALYTAPILPNIVLTDMDMPHMNGIELTRLLRERYPATRIIVLTVYNQERYVQKMVAEGVSGYLDKDCTADELLNALEAVHRTGFYFNPAMLRALQRSMQQRVPVTRNINNIPVYLTEREKEVLVKICQENTNGEIAETLFLSIRTVEGYRNSLLEKTGCRNTAGLVIFAIRYGIFDPVF